MGLAPRLNQTPRLAVLEANREKLRTAGPCLEIYFDSACYLSQIDLTKEYNESASDWHPSTQHTLSGRLRSQTIPQRLLASTSTTQGFGVECAPQGHCPRALVVALGAQTSAASGLPSLRKRQNRTGRFLTNGSAPRR